jgi:hypothetical protein
MLLFVIQFTKTDGLLAVNDNFWQEGEGRVEVEGKG